MRQSHSPILLSVRKADCRRCKLLSRMRVKAKLMIWYYKLCNGCTINSNLAEYSSLRGSNATAAIQTIPLFPNIYFWIASTTACNDGLDIISRQDNTNAKFQFIFLNNLYLKALEHFVRELSVIDEDCANYRISHREF